MTTRNFSAKVVITVLTQRRFCDSQEELYSLIEYLVDMEGNLYNTQRNQAMIICANAMANQIPELKEIDIKSTTDVVLAKIAELETKYPKGIALHKIDKGSYTLKNPVKAYTAMVDPEEI